MYACMFLSKSCLFIYVLPFIVHSSFITLQNIMRLIFILEFICNCILVHLHLNFIYYRFVKKLSINEDDSEEQPLLADSPINGEICMH